jgi:hypothetical protein
MTKTMKKAYRMFRRKGRQNFYIQNNATREQRCLGTSNPEEAQRLLDAENQARQVPALNMQLGKAYITHADPKMRTRTWQSTVNIYSNPRHLPHTGLQKELAATFA